MGAAIHILVVEDDPNMSFLLKNNLEQEGYTVHCCDNGADAWRLFNEMPFDLCMLDVMLPKQDGFTLASMMRKSSHVPLLFLTARTLKEDIYKGFEIGADDYITKPFTARELLLRIQAILRRTALYKQPEQQTVYRIGDLHFNYVLREIKGRAQVKKLSTKENELLRMFCESRNAVLARNRILTEVWGNDDYFVSKSLDVYITKLRKLLSEDPNISIMNYHGVGYKMVERTDTVVL
jgi:two-component system, OmpR family, response regulator